MSGLSAIQRRAGTWDTFRRTMQARLSDAKHFPSLQDLTTRDNDDPSIAFLDAAATVCDVLTFYSERFANEGYLRTATQRRSLMELGKLVGYRPRPGVAASAWLAFKLDAGYAIEVPAGTRVQSVPASPKETAQTFETSAALNARAELNELKPRLSVPQEISPANVLSIETIWLKGTGLNLKAGDMLLFAFPSDEAASTPRKIHTVTEDAAAQRTAVKLEVEKLSAAYHVPVLRKAAQALRQSIPDAWLTDAKKWAKGAAAALDVVIPKLGADTSLLKLEELFLPSPGQTKGLDDHLQAASDAGETALSFRDGLVQRAAWESDFTEKVESVLEKATAQEKLLGEVFTQLETIDAHSTAAEVEIRKTAAREIVKSLAEGTDTAPGEIRKCFPSVKAVLTALRTLAANASDAANHTVWNSIGLGPANSVPARTNANTLGLHDPEKTARTDGMAVLDSAKGELTAGKPDDAAKLLLDDGAGSLQKKIDAAAAHAAVQSLFQEIKDALDKEWTNLQTPMYQKLDAGTVEDELLQSFATKNAGHVDALPVAATATHESRAVAFVELAGKSLELLEGDGAQNRESKAELEDVATTGLLSRALTDHRKRLRAESLQGFRNAIQQLTSRYKAAVAAHPTVGPALALLQTEAATFPPNGTLAELHGKLTIALNVVRDVLKKGPDTVINQLRAEMEILDGQVSFSPSGAGTAGGISSPASGAALGKIVGGTTLKQPSAPGDPLAISRSLGAFVSSGGGTGGVASDAVSRLAGRLAGSTDDELFAAWRLLNTGTPPVEIYAMRAVTTVFGSGAPMRIRGQGG